MMSKTVNEKIKQLENRVEELEVNAQRVARAIENLNGTIQKKVYDVASRRQDIITEFRVNQLVEQAKFMKREGFAASAQLTLNEATDLLTESLMAKVAEQLGIERDDLPEITWKPNLIKNLK